MSSLPSRAFAFAALRIVALLALVSSTALAPSCRMSEDSPTVQTFESMTDEQFAAWSSIARTWSEAAGEQLVRSREADVERVQAVASALRVAIVAPTAPLDLARIASECGLQGPLAAALLATGQTLLTLRGGLGLPQNRLEVLIGTIAAGLEAGALRAAQGPLQPR